MRRRKKRQVTVDPATRTLVEGGVYSFHTDEGIIKASRHRIRFPYGFWSGVKYILILSVLLWWLPTLGQMIAGYVGGRRTGSPWKGVAAAILPVAVVFSISYMASYGILTEEIHFLYALPATVATMMAGGIPILAPYIEFTIEYMAAFIATLKITFSMGLNGYFVTIIFAYIGGVVGQQVKRELALRATSPTIALHTINTGVPVSTSRDTMRRPATWWAKHPERLEEMRKIPVRTVAKKKGRTAATPKKVVAKPKPKARPMARASKASPKELGKKGYDKNTVNKRLVERALGRYKR